MRSNAPYIEQRRQQLKERTLALIKPGAIKAGTTSRIIDRYVQSGLSIVGAHVFTFHPFQVALFYQEHMHQDYFARMLQNLCRDCCLALILEGDNAISTVRALNGPSNEHGQIPGTIRHDFRAKGGVVHGSDSAAAANREIGIVFNF